MNKLNLIPLVFVVILGCSTQVKRDNFNENVCKKYKTDVLKTYKNFYISDLIDNPTNFVRLSSSSCGTSKLKTGRDYRIIQALDIRSRAYNDETGFYDIKNDKTGSFYYELMHFKDAVRLDSLIKEIKEKNCLEPFNLRINRIYRLGTNTLIILNYYSCFDVNSYEKLLKTNFNNDVQINKLNLKL